MPTTEKIYDIDDSLPVLILKSIALIKELEYKIYGLSEEQTKIKYLCGHCGDLARQLVDTLTDLYEKRNLPIPTLLTKQIPVKRGGSHTYLLIDNPKAKKASDNPDDAYLYVDIMGIHTYAEVEKIQASTLFEESLKEYENLLNTNQVPGTAMWGNGATLVFDYVFSKNDKNCPLNPKLR